MKNKKRGIFLIIILLIIFQILFQVFLTASEFEENKISPEVQKTISKEGEARVIINLEEGKTNFEDKNIKKQALEDIKENIGEENIKHVFDDSIAIEISKDNLEELNKNPTIDSVEIDIPVKAFLQDSIQLINASTAWQIKISNKNITGIDETICVIDTGINFTHPDLIGKNKTCNIDCINQNCVENCTMSDDNGHGTHVGGIVAATGRINGVAVAANLIGIKALDSSGGGYSSDIYAGMRWCITNANAYNISVISMSLGIVDGEGDEVPYYSHCDSEYSTFSSIINNATFNNISVVIAAGNAGFTNAITAPACIYNATSVSASTKTNSMIYNRANITDIVAPGVNINSTFFGGACPSACSCSGNYMRCSGTSMATPHVAGAFSIIRQFFKLQNNRILTPLEILNISNATGFRINDSSTGLNFSRIDIYSALISLDNGNPAVNLTSPLNATIQFSQNISFICSANDVKLSNITLYLWNSSGIYNNTEIRQFNAVNANAEFNLTLAYGNYNWNCLAYDSKGNFSFASFNNSLTIGRILVSLNSPLNNTFTNQNQSFNCSLETENTKQLANISFYLWNSTGSLVNSSIINLSGTLNSTIFQYNFSSEGNYNWNCLGSNNLSESNSADSNFTINYDVTFPEINLIAPPDSSSYTSNSQLIIFSYNVSDTNLANCSLIINNAISITNSSILNISETQNFSQSFSPGTYNWGINCTDKAGNEKNSSSRSFTVSAPAEQVVSSSGGGGGGGAITTKTYNLTSSQVSGGYTNELNKNDKIIFFDENGKMHTLIINEIKSNYANISIEKIKLAFGIGQSAKLNLTSPDYYDLYLKLENISGNKAKLTIQLIRENMQKPAPITESAVEKNEEKLIEKEEIKKTEEETKIMPDIKKFKLIVYSIILMIIITLIILLISERKYIKNITKTKEKMKEKFKTYIKPRKLNK